MCPLLVQRRRARLLRRTFGGGMSSNPLGFFSKELEASDAQQRVEAISRLRVIALALGPDSARSELLPFLSKFISSHQVPRASPRDPPAARIARCAQPRCPPRSPRRAPCACTPSRPHASRLRAAPAHPCSPPRARAGGRRGAGDPGGGARLVRGVHRRPVRVPPPAAAARHALPRGRDDRARAGGQLDQHARCVPLDGAGDEIRRADGGDAGGRDRVVHSARLGVRPRRARVQGLPRGGRRRGGRRSALDVQPAGAGGVADGAARGGEPPGKCVLGAPRRQDTRGDGAALRRPHAGVRAGVERTRREGEGGSRRAREREPRGGPSPRPSPRPSAPAPPPPSPPPPPRTRSASTRSNQPTLSSA